MLARQSVVHHRMQQHEVARHLLGRCSPALRLGNLCSSTLTQEGVWSQKRSYLIKYATPSVCDT